MSSSIYHVIESWPQSRIFSARAAAAQCSTPITNNDLFELAIEQYLDAVDRQDRPSLNDFVDGFPEIRDRLCQAIAGMPRTDDLDWPSLGEVIDSHLLIKQLAVTSHSRVYLTADNNTGRPMVLKVTTSRSNDLIYLARINHPAVIALYHSTVNVARNTTNIFMPFMSQWNALELIKCHPTSTAKREDIPWTFTKAEYISRVLAMLESIASAIECIHSLGIAHNDIKPSNVIVSSSSQQLIDFDAASDLGVHGTQRAIGTLEYLSHNSLMEISTCSVIIGQNCTADDHFAFAAMCYELITGSLPWKMFGSVPTQELCKVLLSQRNQLKWEALRSEFLSEKTSRQFHCIFTNSECPPLPSALVQTLRADLKMIESRQLSGAPIRTAGAILVSAVATIALCVPFQSISQIESNVNASPSVQLTTPALSRSDRAIELSRNHDVQGIYNLLNGVRMEDISGTEAALLAYAMSIVCPDYKRQCGLNHKAISSGISSASLLNNYGFSMYGDRNASEAYLLFKQAVALDPTVLQPHLHLATLELILNSPREITGDHALTAMRISPASKIVRDVCTSTSDRIRSSHRTCSSAVAVADEIDSILESTRLMPPVFITYCVNPIENKVDPVSSASMTTLSH